MFANAVAYEDMMGRWSARLAPLFADFAQGVDGGRVLDIGCGTGSLVKAVAATTRRSEIVGIDPVQPFIEYSRTRITDPRRTFDCGDALDLPDPAGSFDPTLSLLVRMLNPQPEKAASELRRVIRTGATVAACRWDRNGVEMTSVFWHEALRIDPDAEARSQRPKHSNQAGPLAALWRATGLQQGEETVLEIRIEFRSFDAYWQPHLKGGSPQGVYVAGLAPEPREKLRQALRKRRLADRPDGPFFRRAKSLAVRAIAPKTHWEPPQRPNPALERTARKRAAAKLQVGCQATK